MYKLQNYSQLKNNNETVQTCVLYQREYLLLHIPNFFQTKYHTPKSADALKCPEMLAGLSSGCLLSVLGAGVPYNREQSESIVCTLKPPPPAQIVDWILKDNSRKKHVGRI